MILHSLYKFRIVCIFPEILLLRLHGHLLEAVDSVGVEDWGEGGRLVIVEHGGCSLEAVVGGVGVVGSQVQHQVVISIVLDGPLDLSGIIRSSEGRSILSPEKFRDLSTVTLQGGCISIWQIGLHHYVI